ncbi:hypothetical protein FIBSPDRAFT_958734 [Athelia psychrophila]|uniref:Uncharacterized protein n=1 Tax=Athelia psychrophila TaxID=1759441 RepID=A0A166EAG4_9AGAM|nr:hypothetical protein FIBSPDRAFT_958734 [Fibularhizoctonia sp. CBS 109695]
MKPVAPGDGMANDGGAARWICWRYSGYEEAVQKPDEDEAKANIPAKEEEGRDEIEAADKENEYWEEILRPGHKCMYIVTIAVFPAFQKQCIAGALVQWGTVQADHNGVACWVHSSHAG